MIYADTLLCNTSRKIIKCANTVQCNITTQSSNTQTLCCATQPQQHQVCKHFAVQHNHQIVQYTETLQRNITT